MKAYPEYKDSGVDGLGNVPSHWGVYNLKRLTQFIYGDSLSKENRTDGKIPVYGSNGVVGYHDEATTKAPCLIIGRKGSFGKVNFSDVECFPIDTTYFIDERATQNNIRWLYYLLLSLRLDAYSKDSAVPGLSREDAYERRTVLPPLPEQQAIADFLDRKTAQIDTLIEKKQRQIDLLQEQRTALINHAVTKGLNPNVKMKDSGVEWLEEIPSHWKIAKLKYISPNITVGIVITPAKYYVDDGVPCLRSLNVKERKLLTENLVYISPESNELLQKSKIYSGDLVSVRTGQPGTTAVVDERFNGANCIDLIITRQSKDFDSQFLAYQLNSSLSKAQYTTGSSGAIQQHFNVETASNMFVVLPPLNEQIEIRKKLDLAEKRDEEITDNIGLMIQYLQEYRTALISEAVTGKVDVRKAETVHE